MKFKFNTDFEISFVSDIQYNYQYNYQNKIIIIQQFDLFGNMDLFGIINNTGEILCSCKYKSIMVLKNEYEYFVAVTIFNQSCIINKYGDILCEHNLHNFYINLKRIEKLKTIV